MFELHHLLESFVFYIFYLNKLIPEVIFRHNLSCLDQLQLELDSSTGANHHDKLHYSLSKQALPHASLYGVQYPILVASHGDEILFPVI